MGVFSDITFSEPAPPELFVRARQMLSNEDIDKLAYRLVSGSRYDHQRIVWEFIRPLVAGLAVEQAMGLSNRPVVDASIGDRREWRAR